MPVLKSSKKALRVAKRRGQENDLMRKQIRVALKTLKANPSVKTLSTTFSIIDKATRKSIFHKNKAARLKSAYSKLLAKPKNS